jgi:UDP-N-acetylmuramoyl-L-alanyl-D-glutamate--2,6-diaminopimelate ligase
VAVLQDILYKVSIRAVAGNTAVEVKDLQIDSRKVSPGSAFIAIRGATMDGHQFIDTAIEKGAVAIILESMPADTRDGVTYIHVQNSASAAGFMAHSFYGLPSEKLKLVGVTGTNGKTTIATLL